MPVFAALFLLFPQDEIVRGLIEQLSSERIEARAEAFRKLEAIGRPALPLLEKAAQDPDGEVSSRAKTLLVRIPIRERLTPALVDSVRGIYERLAHGEWKEVFLELAGDLRQPPERRRFSGVRPEDLSFMAPMALQRAVTETEKNAVCEAVGRCRLKSAMPEVVRLLKDDQYMVRANALAAIRDAGAVEQVGDVRSRLGDDHPVVRSVAAHALGCLGAKDAIPELAALLRDPSQDVRWWAVRALGELGAKDRVGEIEKLREDPDDAVRRVARETAEQLRRAPKRE
ncbi:MAG TPA: HEAT repeat domain-containing protein [Planctomycetota bacterium]|nr:HEAT repeat domain-containing protein [Planctomycetota bacterium]